jgi:hypothetical protein
VACQFHSLLRLRTNCLQEVPSVDRLGTTFDDPG